ncbi:GNAT family N-acetyltransferase [Bacteriovorax stolpii]|uniref:GNAT family N-acetyltransferase n=1 Tax=Bacteriovorax stolpii TaxID=960 RepID=UPI00115C0411|nr:GNAT family N-acetyltransferase [Bacteriovorax stolpii]QDK41973.1 GNAT family N-acetyltransferase [Bacteriovorax stolpii]
MSAVLLVPMNEAEYVIWRAKSETNYRDEIVKNGATLAEAQKKADEDFARLLPHGLKSKDQYIFSIKDNNDWVGTLWLGVKGAPDNRKGYIYDIVLNEETRGKGIGKKAMILLEDEVRKLGLHHIGLHVFGHNKVARSLYESLGYEITNLNMEKTL